MDYLLDTNACIALINGKPPVIRARFQKASDAGGKVFVSSIALFELWYGVAKSDRVQENTERLRILLTGGLDLLDFDDEDAAKAL